jgi:hypothetical protein
VASGQAGRWYGIAVFAFIACGVALPALAQPPERTGITMAYERTRDRFHYRFENPSSFDTTELVPHEFTQTYWGDNHWFIVRGTFTAGSRLFETEAAATPQVSTRGDDYDTFFQPSGDIVVTGTTGGVSMRSWRVSQMIGLTRTAGVDWSLGFQYRQDRSEFHPGLKSTQHTQPPSREEEWIYTRETTISRTYGVAVRPRRTWEGASWRLTVAGDIVPVMTARLTTLLPDKYPGRTIVFSALVMSAEPKLIVEIGRRRPITISAGYSSTLSYLKSRQFVRHAVHVAAGVCF